MNPRFLLPLLLISASAHAATLSVLSNTSIQTKIDAAKAGDIVAIFGGTYNEDITINKAIRLVKVSGQSVTLAGSVTFSGVTNAPPFDGFTVGSSGRGINVNDTTGLVIRNLDARAGSGITINGTSSLSIADSQLSNVYENAGAVSISNSSLTGGINDNGDSLKISKTTLAGGISHTAGTLHASTVTIGGNFDTSDNAQKTVAFRTTVAGDIHWRSKKAWLGYAGARSFEFLGNNASVVIVGCKFDPSGGSYQNGVVRLDGYNNKFNFLNSSIMNVNYFHYERVAAFWNHSIVVGASDIAVIRNNYIQMKYVGWGANSTGTGNAVLSGSSKLTVDNNIFQGCRIGVTAPFGAQVNNNMHFQPTTDTFFDGGVIAIHELINDPLFVENEAPKLQAGSPCINAGTPDPLYNDRDGSQNDIGPAGGAWFDPEGWTTDKPVVISFDLSPEQVLEGADTEVVISNGGAVSQP
jgi:hypothetical protein